MNEKHGQQKTQLSYDQNKLQNTRRSQRPKLINNIKINKTLVKNNKCDKCMKKNCFQRLKQFFTIITWPGGME